MNLRKTSSIFIISLKGGNTIDVIISLESKKAFIYYINTHSKAKDYESKCSHIDNITENIEEYFKIKLKKEDYDDILEIIIKDKGIFSEGIMKRWIRKNYNENYLIK